MQGWVPAPGRVVMTSVDREKEGGGYTVFSVNGRCGCGCGSHRGCGYRGGRALRWIVKVPSPPPNTVTDEIRLS